MHPKKVDPDIRIFISYESYMLCIFVIYKSRFLVKNIFVFLRPKKSTHPRKFICSLRGCRYPDSFGSFGFQVSINQELLFKKPSLYNLFLASKKVYIGRCISYKPQNFGEVSYVNPISLDDKSSNFVFVLIR